MYTHLGVFIRVPIVLLPHPLLVMFWMMSYPRKILSLVKKIMVANPLPDPVLGEPHLTLLLLVGEKGHIVLGLVVLVPPHPPDLGCTSKIINK